MDASNSNRPRGGQLVISDTDSRATIEMRAPKNEFSFTNLRVPVKLAIIVLLLTVPLLFFVFQTLQRQSAATRLLTQDSKGAVFLKDSTKLFELLGQYRTNSTVALSGDGQMSVVSSQAEQISSEIERLIQDNQTNRDEFGIASLLDNLKTEWLSIRGGIASMTSDQSFQRQSDLIQNRFNPIIQQVGNASGLILESELDTSLIQNLLIRDLPETIETYSQLGGYAQGLLVRKTASASEKATVAGYLDRAKIGRDKMERDMAAIAAANPSLQEPIRLKMEKVAVASSAAVRRATFDVVEPVVLFASPKTFATEFSKGISLYGDLYRFNIDTLQSILLQRTLSLQRTGLANLLLVIGVFLIALLFTGIVINSIATPLNDMTKVVQKFGDGDLSQLIPVRSRDELGVLAGSFNNSILQLRDFLSRQEEDRLRNVQLQNNIGEFLNVAMDISGGDLTKKGRVSEDVLGNVVDAINLLTEEIGYLLKDVQTTTDKVNSGATDVTSVSKSIAESALNQTEIAQQAQQQTLDVTTTMRQMSDSAQEASLAASQALEASQAGQLAVTNTLNGMQSIRREVQNISKGIKSLSDRSLEISEIVETISGIAAQTNLLALNAAIEASGAGDAGSRFAIVADEVRKLAEDSTRATSRVSNLIKGIQTEIQAAVVGVETGTKEVEAGYRIATQAGERLSEIANLTNQSAAFAQTIASSTRVQVNQINNVAQAVQVMAGTAEKTAIDSKQGQNSAETLLKLSQQLSQSLARFQLPA
jgi:twitching motility protein PilJ